MGHGRRKGRRSPPRNDDSQATTDYLAEVWGLWQAIALYKNIPVDFVDEAGLLEPETLKPFKVRDLPCSVRREGGQSLVIGGSSLVILERKACNPL